MVCVRGDHELCEPKLRKLIGEFRLATADEVVAAQGVDRVLALQNRHAQIHEDDIRVFLPGDGYCLFPGLCHPGQIIPTGLDDLYQIKGLNSVIFDYENTIWYHSKILLK